MDGVSRRGRQVWGCNDAKMGGLESQWRAPLTEKEILDELVREERHRDTRRYFHCSTKPSSISSIYQGTCDLGK